MIEKKKFMEILSNEKTKQEKYKSFHPILEKPIKNFNIKSNKVGKKFTVLLSHDIDKIEPTNIEIISRLIKQRKLISKNPKRNPYWTFNKILNIEKKYGVKSTWFFKSSGKSYNINDKNLKVVINKIIKKGNEIGLHADFESFNNLNNLKKEKNLLENSIGNKVFGVRNHYLLFDVNKTWDIQEKCGFKYDSTYGYANEIGYRNGDCFSFNAYSLEQKKELDLIVLPLTIMDCTLLNYMNLNIEESFNKVKELIDIVKNKKGIIVINWHNDYFSDILHKNAGDLYDKILSYVRKKQGFMPTMNKYYKMMKNE
ncbi:MAG: polysaccharide deacetylase family protein [Candidatus Woesearchaeota archaeon]